jgi:hypothetical protein
MRQAFGLIGRRPAEVRTGAHFALRFNPVGGIKFPTRHEVCRETLIALNSHPTFMHHVGAEMMSLREGKKSHANGPRT